MFMVIAIVLFVCWLLGMAVFKLTKGVIHVVLLIAIVAICVHFFRGG
ncbi:MAG TPA: lmo0937 family membrane protein [Gemmatimonadaceae bacterium]|nr:lmo0937 family membrane protein [Gemmatimonadaceae bacterium]